MGAHGTAVNFTHFDWCESSFNDRLTLDESLEGHASFPELCVRGVQAVLVAFEMMIAAWCHRKVFTCEAFHPTTGAAQKAGFLTAMAQMLDVSDVHRDVSGLVGEQLVARLSVKRTSPE
jgi:hypothetical protein